jgi:predicted acylesterase/phospholipase RssA
MRKINSKNTAIACMSGGYKTVFTHGVLTAFENKAFFVDAYAGCSSSALVSAYASIEKISSLDISSWLEGLRISKEEGNSQSNAIMHSIDVLLPILEKGFKGKTLHRLLIAASFVKTAEASEITQSEQAKRWGQKLLLEASRNIATWRDENLELHIFDSQAADKNRLLTYDNFREVSYASTRMLHAWHMPAFIDGAPYVDGSYTCLYPVVPLVNLGYEKIICILTEADSKKNDMFSSEDFNPQLYEATIDFIKPDINLKNIGVDYYSATENSLKEAFIMGYKKGIDYYNNHNLT